MTEPVSGNPNQISAAAVSPDFFAYVHWIARKTNNPVTNIAYAVADASGSSYSALKNICDFMHANSPISASDALHDLLVSPEGIAIATMVSLGLISFSVMGNLFNDNDKVAIRRYIAKSWPYMRDSLKGVKNSFKGIRSALTVASVITTQDLRYALIPSALALGAFSIVNRIWYRHMIEERKTLMSKNRETIEYIHGVKIHYNLKEFPTQEQLEDYKSTFIIHNNKITYITKDRVLKRINVNPEFTKNLLEQLNPPPEGSEEPPEPEERSIIINREIFYKALAAHNASGIDEELNQDLLNDFRAGIGSQKQWADKNKTPAFISQTVGGLIDGLYLYMGVMVVGALCPPLFIAMAAISAVFTVLCFISRAYEEYDFQKKLKISQAKVELSICDKELGMLYREIQKKSAYATKEELEPLKCQFKEKFQELQKLHHYLRDNRQNPSTLVALLEGIKEGMAAYSAITCLMFAVVTGFLLAGAAFPPLLIAITVGLGLLAMLGLVGHSLYKHYTAKDSNHDEPFNQELTVPNTEVATTVNEEVVTSINENDTYIKFYEENHAKIETVVQQNIAHSDAEQSVAVRFFMFLRNLFSGPKKAENFAANFAFTALQEPDSQGHYQDTPATVGLSIGIGALFTLTFGAYELGRRFGRPSIDGAQIEKINLHAPAANDPVSQPVETVIPDTITPTIETSETVVATEDSTATQESDNRLKELTENPKEETDNLKELNENQRIRILTRPQRVPWYKQNVNISLEIPNNSLEKAIQIDPEEPTPPPRNKKPSPTSITDDLDSPRYKPFYINGEKENCSKQITDFINELEDIYNCNDEDFDEDKALELIEMQAQQKPFFEIKNPETLPKNTAKPASPRSPAQLNEDFDIVTNQISPHIRFGFLNASIKPVSATNSPRSSDEANSSKLRSSPTHFEHFIFPPPEAENISDTSSDSLNGALVEETLPKESEVISLTV